MAAPYASSDGAPPSSAAGKPPPRSSSHGRRPASPQGGEDPRRGLDRRVPGGGVALLGPDVEGHPGGVEPQAGGESEHLDGLRGRAAVLARQRPVRAAPGRHDPAEHGRTRRGLGDLVGLHVRVHHEQPDAHRRGRDDVGAPLDGVGVDEVGRACAGVEAGLHLGGAGHVEARAGLDEGAEKGRVRVGLDGVVHRRPGKGGPELAEANERGRHVQLEDRGRREPGVGARRDGGGEHSHVGSPVADMMAGPSRAFRRGSRHPQPQIHRARHRPRPCLGGRVREPPPDVDQAALLTAIQGHWTPEVDGVEHLPVGFGAHHWVASVHGRPTLFVTLDTFGPHHDAASLEAAYAVASGLMFPLDFVVAPVPSTAGTLTVAFAGGALSVTPWVNGETPAHVDLAVDVGDADPAACRATAPEPARVDHHHAAVPARRPRRPLPHSVGLRPLRRARPRRPARPSRRGRRVVGRLPRPRRGGAAQALGDHPRGAARAQPDRHPRHHRCSWTGRASGSRPPSATGGPCSTRLGAAPRHRP